MSQYVTVLGDNYSVIVITILCHDDEVREVWYHFILYGTLSG